MFFGLLPVRESLFRKSKEEYKSLRAAKILKRAQSDRDMRLKEDAAKKEEEESRDLEQRTMSLAQWQKKLGEVVPLSMVPDVLNTHPGYVAMAIREGRLPVHTFHAQNGKKYRVVRVNTLRELARLSREPKNLWEISLYYGLTNRQP